ncbi:hypothetical protein HMPREF1325_2407 [Treponema socranskii subsp. socranskii VPI DR56BR1116 = ATCC 35536]|uniref:Uncharacterized protein n=1 Tax=Treponema socranskii subsp. socranskii VPI DR56BR1116 = ATCC 35536 TaxID=1125725 RepID=U1GUP5_TRESO|nr:hypothetical protein HMPREF1325_2407 [Treponema socranskii subsp. socranskii VPI DR56BR1116 = ATCC 35536]
MRADDERQKNVRTAPAWIRQKVLKRIILLKLKQHYFFYRK